MTSPSSMMLMLRTLGRAVLLAGATLWFAAGTVWAFYLPLPSSPKPRPTPPAPTSPGPSPTARPIAAAPAPGGLHPARTAPATMLKPVSPLPMAASPIRTAAMSPVLPTTATATLRVATHAPSRPKSKSAHSPRR